MTISSTVLCVCVFLNSLTLTPTRLGKWLVTSQLQWSLCEMLETVGINKSSINTWQTCSFKTKDEGQRGWDWVGANCNWYCPSDPSHTWCRHNITPQGSNKSGPVILWPPTNHKSITQRLDNKATMCLQTTAQTPQRKHRLSQDVWISVTKTEIGDLVLTFGTQFHGFTVP